MPTKGTILYYCCKESLRQHVTLARNPDTNVDKKVEFTYIHFFLLLFFFRAALHFRAGLRSLFAGSSFSILPFMSSICQPCLTSDINWTSVPEKKVVFLSILCRITSLFLFHFHPTSLLLYISLAIFFLYRSCFNFPFGLFLTFLSALFFIIFFYPHFSIRIFPSASAIRSYPVHVLQRPV